MYLFFLVFGAFVFVQCRHKEDSAVVSVEKFNKDSILSNDPVLKKSRFDGSRHRTI
jgi:hypothetical protein